MSKFFRREKNFSYRKKIFSGRKKIFVEKKNFFGRKKIFSSTVQEKIFFPRAERSPRVYPVGRMVPAVTRRWIEVQQSVSPMSARLFGVDRHRGMQALRAARKVVCPSGRRVRRFGRSVASTDSVGKRTRPAWRRLYLPGGVSHPTFCRRTSYWDRSVPRTARWTSPNGDSGPASGIVCGAAATRAFG